MLTNITPAAERAMNDARKWAVRTGGTTVHPEHLLAALLDQEGGSVEGLLVQAGLNISEKAKFLESLITQEVPQTEEQLGETPLSPALEKVWHRARKLAGDSADGRVVASEHLLLALLENEPTLREHLEMLGVNSGKLNPQLQAPKPLSLDEPLALAEPTEETQLARILDASANRAREALRVLEDYGRFALGDVFLSSQLKETRHELADALSVLPFQQLLESRETERDVGRTLTAAGEESRHSLDAVVQVNCKRLQEALRSLEEYGKIHGPDLGHRMEKLRYRSYTLERALTLGNLARQRLADVPLCILVMESECVGELEWTVKEAIAGGASMIQLREKNLSDRELLDSARNVRAWTKTAGVIFIVNDRPDIARLAEADGVHLGQEDMRVMEARRILGTTRLIGVSTHNLDQTRQAILDGVSYIGVGPTFPSTTKEFAEYPGLEFIRQVSKLTTLPAFAIGGITIENIRQVAEVGATRVAVSQAVCKVLEPRRVAMELLQALKGDSLPESR
jgi:thiamine-phosphate pyrophosphorylase